MILWFEEITDKMIASVGGKGMNLGILTKYGINVPKGFCITTQAYKNHLQNININNEIEILHQKNLTFSDIEKTSSTIQEKIISAPISPTIIHSVSLAMKELGYETPVAVRSSATAEDLPNASFAGQQETYLYVRGVDEILTHMKYCWASLWGARAIQYRQNASFNDEKIAIAVVVQMMVKSEIAGVLFTINPVSHILDEFLINASYGLGEAVVSGLVTPDTYIVDKNYNILDKSLGSKEHSIVQDSNKGTVTVVVEEDLRNIYCLTDQQIKTLCSVGTEIEEIYGVPQDIEWAFVKNSLFLLQARPVTSMNKEENDKVESNITNTKHFKDKHGMREHYPLAPLPLETAFMNDIINSKYEIFSRVGLKLGDGARAFFYENENLVTHESIPRLNTNILNIFAEIKAMASKPTSFESANQERIHKQKIKKAEQFNIAIKSNCEIFEWTMKLKKNAYDLYVFRFESYAFPMVIIGKKLKMFSAVWGKKRIEQYEFLADLSYVTADIDKRIHDLAFSSKGPTRELLIEKKFHELLTVDLESEQDRDKIEFTINFRNLLCNFGSRSSRPYQLFSDLSWGEDPAQLLRLCAIILAGESETYYREKISSTIVQYKKTIAEISERMSSAHEHKFMEMLKMYRAAHQGRESTLYLLEQYYSLIRLGMKQLASNMQGECILDDENQLYYLTLEELYSMIFDNNYEAIKIAKQRFTKRAEVLAFWSPKHNSVQKLKGIPGSAGEIIGEVCIIDGISQFDRLKKGQILVCPYTDPSWTPLFSLASGVISDTGGALSHAAIVAREYGIPAVLGAKYATTTLKDGDIVVVNGYSGTVQKII